MSDEKPKKRVRLGRDVQQQRILDAASRLFAEKGYHGTGIEEISKAVGLGRGALYHHMGSKESVLFDICSINVIEMIAVAREIGDAEGSAEPRLRRLLLELTRHIARNKDGWAVFFRDYIALNGTHYEEVVGLRTEFERLLTGLVEEGMEAGEFQRMDRVVVKGILGQINYTYLWIDENGRMSPDEVAGLFCDLLLGGLRVPAGSPDPVS